MPPSEFVHLSVHTAFSLAEGAIQIKDLVSRCAEENMPAVGIADTGNLFGALEFAVTASEAGIQPIIGVQLNVRRKSISGEKLHQRTQIVNSASNTVDRLILIAKNEQGYLNLLDLVSKSFLDSDDSELSQISFEDLEKRNEGLIVLTGWFSGEVGKLILDDRILEAEKALLNLQKVFNDRLYLEIQRHGIPDERLVEEQLLEFAYKYDIPLVATNDCYFDSKDFYDAHDILLCIAQSTTISNSSRKRLTSQHYFKSASEMAELFKDLPEAVENTIAIAKRCSFMPKTLDPILPKFVSAGVDNEEADLRLKSFAGLEKRFQENVFTMESDEYSLEEKKKLYKERLQTELSIINQMGFSGYFLIVADFIQWAKKTGIPVGPGRGSGAGSLVAWSLLITDLDPIRWGLLFERFLNPERISMPDFDIDFCQERRGEVIDYVQGKYGEDRVAQIITFGKLQARAVLRDVGRVLEMPYGQVDRICKMVPNNPANPMTLGEAIAGDAELRKLRDEDESIATLLGNGLQLEGLYRNASTHAAGLVIGDRPLRELVPLYKDTKSDMSATQFNMKWVESAGLVKFDFLGLKTLSVIQRATELLKERNIQFDLSELPLDDEKTYKMIGRGDSVGVFQLESSGMRDVLKKMRPDRFEDIIALVALYRPGPMANIPNYIARKHGKEKVDFMHEKLEPVLQETYGIMIYQEQVQQAAQQLAGYTLGGADLLRRAMGKKIKSEMDAQREVFVEGAVRQGVSSEKAASIFETISAFAGYGFNKSHAAAYALIAYQTAFLKANFPVEFMAASMTFDMGNTDKLGIFRQELKSLDIEVLPPDINKSGPDFRVERIEGSGSLVIRYALSAIKNVGGPGMEALENERLKNGPFRDLSDFISRVDAKVVNKRSMENLIRSGAFDSIHNNRAELFEGLDIIMRHVNATIDEGKKDQHNLFSGDETTRVNRVKLTSLEEWPVLKKLRNEFEAIGFYLTAHPLDSYGDALIKNGVISSSTLVSELNKKGGMARMDVAGIVSSSRIRVNQRGNKYAFVQMSDQGGIFEVTVFSEVLSSAGDSLIPGEALLIRCDCKLENDFVRLVASKISSLDCSLKNSIKGFKIYINDQNTVTNLAKILERQEAGSGEIKLVVQNTNQEFD
ncbi:MAG: DNA polymerase III subunit alpha, partial [Pseudomonadota bacterium]|nr:DNA polymerase III subunit alpha [Pseudomonadota bacterium]